MTLARRQIIQGRAASGALAVAQRPLFAQTFIPADPAKTEVRRTATSRANLATATSEC